MLSYTFLTFFVFFLLASNAYAYIDYGTGSYVLQILAASAVGALFFLKSFAHRIKNIFTKKGQNDLENGDQSENL